MQAKPPLIGPYGQVLAEPIVVLNKRLVKRDNKVVTQILVQWVNLPVEVATLLSHHRIKQFPWFDPCGQECAKGEGREM